MNELEQDIKNTQVSIQEANEEIKLAEALDRLQLNPDFKVVINEAYIEAESTRICLAMSDNEMRHPDAQAALAKSAYAIGALNEFLCRIINAGNQAKAMLPEHEKSLEEIEK